jgi:Uma2 family endonuclease
MGMPATRPRRWTAAEVRQLIAESPMYGPRYELIDGELLVSPSPRIAHQRAVAWLFAILRPYVVRNGLGELLWSPADLRLRAETISQPDLFVIPPEQSDSKTWAEVSRIILSVEVLSPGTVRNDRGTKREHYQRAGVDEYWIVDLESRLIERWRPSDIKPEILGERMVWHPVDAAQHLTIELTELWAAALPDSTEQ